jgi:hypothetical protein
MMRGKRELLSDRTCYQSPCLQSRRTIWSHQNASKQPPDEWFLGEGEDEDESEQEVVEEVQVADEGEVETENEQKDRRYDRYLEGACQGQEEVDSKEDMESSKMGYKQAQRSPGSQCST